MKELVIILPEKPSDFLECMMNNTIGNLECTIIKDHKNLPDLRNKKIVFAIELNEIGISNTLNLIMLELYKRGKDSLKGSSACVLLHSKYNNLTKTLAQSLIYLANNLGCSFCGRPLVEATRNLDNFKPFVRLYNISLEEICFRRCKELGELFLNDNNVIRNNRMLVLHSSNRETSNTLKLWDMVKANLLKDMEIFEIHLGNGIILDCKGCSYTTCKHYGKQNKCYYGGIVVDDIYPALINSSSLMLLCPNYNDMLTANLVATINRLTALFRNIKFYDKNIFSIIVSGYSGGDALAKQIISSLNINKTFNLPPYFSLQATANDINTIYDIEGIENEARKYSDIILNR